MMAGRLLAATALAVLAGCVAPSQFVVPSAVGLAPDAFAYPDADQRVLLIYNHGSRADHVPDRCEPNGLTTPKMVKGLSGRKVGGLQILVYGLCTNVVGRWQGVDQPEGIKLMRRVEKIEQTVQEFLDAGVPAANIFLVGHSAGGWASLLVVRRGRVPVNAAIAFAPAFAGRKSRRSEKWQALRDQQEAFLSGAERLDALVYVFERDAFNAPEELAFLDGIPGTRVHHLDDEAIDGVRCRRPRGHRTAFGDCFRLTQEAAILAYIARQLEDKEQTARGGPPRP